MNNAICPCVFIKKSSYGFVIIAVYVDDLNIIGLMILKFCLGLQIEQIRKGVFVHQSKYTKRLLKHFYMDKATPLSTPMVNRSLDVKRDDILKDPGKILYK